MDAKSAIEAVEAIRGTVPEAEKPVFDAKLAGRYTVVSEAVGSLATQGAEAVNEPVAEVVVPVIDDDTWEKLDTLPPDYREEVVSRYAAKYRAVDGYIRAGKLLEAYRLPELHNLIDKITALAPTFEAVSKIGTPTFEFFPKQLSEDQWNDILSGHELKDGQHTTGSWRSFNNQPVDPTGQEDDGSLWGVIVVDVAESPAIHGISADGARAVPGVDAKKAIKALKELPDVTETKDTELIVKQASPSEAAYRGVQLSRLERSEAPLDPRTWTIAKENVKVGDVLESVFVNLRPDVRTVYSRWDYRDLPNDGSVVRASGER